jgi:hypothetical protein
MPISENANLETATASVTTTPTVVPFTSDEPVVPSLLPGEPPEPDHTLQDSDASLRAEEHRVLTGDNILNKPL